MSPLFGEVKPVGRMLSVGSSDGALERHLASINTARRIEGIDLSPGRMQIAREEAPRNGLDDLIHYHVCNVASNDFAGSDYDAIYFNSSLHHMSNLDAILHRCRNALRQDGFLFVNEYIGPNRMAYSVREKEVMQGVFQMIPEKFRLSHADHDRGKVRKRVYFPDPKEVKRVDPSEAILKLVFDIEETLVSSGDLAPHFALIVATR